MYCPPAAAAATAQNPVIKLSESQLPLLAIVLHPNQQVLKTGSEKAGEPVWQSTHLSALSTKEYDDMSAYACK